LVKKYLICDSKNQEKWLRQICSGFPADFDRLKIKSKFSKVQFFNFFSFFLSITLQWFQIHFNFIKIRNFQSKMSRFSFCRWIWADSHKIFQICQHFFFLWIFSRATPVTAKKLKWTSNHKNRASRMSKRSTDGLKKSSARLKNLVRDWKKILRRIEKISRYYFLLLFLYNSSKRILITLFFFFLSFL